VSWASKLQNVLDQNYDHWQERMVSFLLQHSDWERAVYAVETEPGDISAGKWCEWDFGGAVADGNDATNL
jgi:hypothetical protein